MEKLSKRVLNLSYSKTFVISNRIRELTAEGINVINMAIGQPDFDVPDDIKEAAKKAIDQNYSNYSPVPGFLELREAICEKLERDNNLIYSPNQVCVSTGAKQGIINVLLALINEGDEVILPSPYWVSYKEMVKLAGGTPVIINTSIEADFKISGEQLEQAISSKTKAILYSSPCNPSGIVYTHEELNEISKVIKKHPNITVLSDEIYEFINYDGKHTSIAEFSSIKNQVVIINGLSKSHAMTGWRLGYSVSPMWLAKAVEKIQGQVTSGSNTITQRAAITALKTDYREYKPMIDEYKIRRNLIYDLISSIPHFKMMKPQAAFYAFPDISYYIGKRLNGTTINDADDFALFILENAHVGCVGGNSFGAPNCIRFSYATSQNNISEAMTRIKECLTNYTIE